MAVAMKLLRVAALSFALNFVWENLHSYLYASYKGGPITEWVLFHAALGDMVMLTVLALPFALSPRWHARLWLIVPIGLVLAIVIELYALDVGRWAYNAHMPIIPLFNVGLTPTIQLALLGYLTYWLVL